MLSSSLAGSRTIARPSVPARPSVAAAGLRIRRAQRPSRLTMHADKAAVSPARCILPAPRRAELLMRAPPTELHPVACKRAALQSCLDCCLVSTTQASP